MKVVYVGPLDGGGTCYARMKALEQLHCCEIIPFDSGAYFSLPIGKCLNAIERRIFVGPRFCKCNFDLRSVCRDNKPDVIWIDKGFWIWPSTLRVLREKEVFLVHHNTDSLSPGLWHIKLAYLLMRRTLPLFDLYFTTNIQDYRTLSGKEKPHTELAYLGYDNRRFDNSPLTVSVREQWENELLFVGHYEPSTEDGILALVEAGLPVTVYGMGWERAKRKSKLRGHVKFRNLSDEEYTYALKGAKIGLCFVSKLNGNQTAGRSFEIPAHGTFLLAVRTNQHMDCYMEGKEAEFFGNHQELVQKARYYLEHENQRREIALLGHQRCITSDYSWARYMRDDWDKVVKAMG